MINAEINDQDVDDDIADDDDLASIFVQTKYGRQTTGWKKNLYIWVISFWGSWVYKAF